MLFAHDSASSSAFAPFHQDVAASLPLSQLDRLGPFSYPARKLAASFAAYTPTHLRACSCRPPASSSAEQEGETLPYQISNRRDLLQWHPGHSVLVLEPAPLLPPLLLQLLLSGPTFRLQQVNGLIDRIFRISTAMLAVTEVAGGAPFHLPIAREAWAQTQPA